MVWMFWCVECVNRRVWVMWLPQSEFDFAQSMIEYAHLHVAHETCSRQECVVLVVVDDVDWVSDFVAANVECCPSRLCCLLNDPIVAVHQVDLFLNAWVIVCG